MKSFGANLNAKQYWLVLAACAIASVIEGYNLSAFAQLNQTIYKLYFQPWKASYAHQLFNWSVFIAPLISRPLGSLALGHVADSYGRRASLFLSLFVMMVPCVLIGILPTYATLGAAAPLLLCGLWFVQGLGLGGELGTAVAYMYEVGPKDGKSLGASAMFAALTGGTLLGAQVIMVLFDSVNGYQLEAGAWRIPFLLTALTGAAGVILRWHMPEPYELLNSQGRREHHHSGSSAQSPGFHSRSGSGASLIQADYNSSGAGSPTALTLGQREYDQNSMANDYGRSSSYSVAPGVTAGVDSSYYGAPDSWKQQPYGSAAGGLVHRGKSAGDSYGSYQTSDVYTTADQYQRQGSYAADQWNTASNSFTTPASAWPMQQSSSTSAVGYSRNQHRTRSASGLSSLPVVTLFMQHWREVLLLFLFEAWSAMVSYTAVTWLPGYMSSHLGLPGKEALTLTLTNMAIGTAFIPVAAYLCDRGVPKVAAVVLTLAGAAVASIPAVLLTQSYKLFTIGAVQLGLLAVDGFVRGFWPAIAYGQLPVNVRATGMNLSYSAGRGWGKSAVHKAVAWLESSRMATNKHAAIAKVMCAAAVVSAMSVAGTLERQPGSTKRHKGKTKNDSLPLAY